MFMVFTTAAGDSGGWGVGGSLLVRVRVVGLCFRAERLNFCPTHPPTHQQPHTHTTTDPTIVRLAFDTIERIVREHFGHITETEPATFTDCVNCLIAFTNNPHSLEVALNSIAFLRFCAMRLAEGLPAAAASTSPTAQSAAAAAALAAAPLAVGGVGADARDEAVYYWFPLLAGLSELTFDPRQEIRYGALEVRGLVGLGLCWGRGCGDKIERSGWLQPTNT